VAPGSFIVGAASAQFSADWVQCRTLPSLPEMSDFIREYELARPTPFTPKEGRLVNAANLLQ
jgi:hypothetical protein